MDNLQPLTKKELIGFFAAIVILSIVFDPILVFLVRLITLPLWILAI